jgi:hypothetical protein
MHLRPALLWLRNFLGFRTVLERAGQKAEPVARFTLWQRLAEAHQLTIVPGESLARSELHGTYQGLELRIGLAPEGLRVVTTFQLALPGEPRPELYERVKRSKYVAEQCEALLAEFAASAPTPVVGYRESAAPTPPEQVLAVRQIFVSMLMLSKSGLVCEARYLEELHEYETILTLMASIARWATDATAAASAPDMAGGTSGS